MADIFDIAADFRAALLRRERSAAAAMVRAYGLAWRGIREELDALNAAIAEEAQRGPIPTSWLYEADRLPRLLARIRTAIDRYSVFVEQSIAELQRDAVQLSQAHAEALMLASFGPIPAGASVALASLPDDALIDLAGFLANGSPLRQLLESFGPRAELAAERALFTNIAAGAGPRQTAAALRRALGTTLTRSLTISRTESLRVYREGSHRAYQRNETVLEGWIWWSGTDRRTCAACWAMHGTFHPLWERVNDHPNGRCSALPRAKSWQALGYDLPDTRPTYETGVERFARLSAADQREVLGPGKFALYESGQIGLPDLVGVHIDAAWGSHRYERSLKAITGGV